MEAHQITLQRGMKKFKGHMIVGDSALYFLCSNSGSAWWDVVGQGVGGLVGGVVKGIGAMREGEAAEPEALTEDMLRDAVSKSPDSMIFEPANIEAISQTIWMRTLRANGEKFGVTTGYSKPLRKELGPWSKRHGVKAKGML